MKALKLKSSTKENPVWGDIRLDCNYARVEQSPVPVICLLKRITQLSKLIIIDSDRRQFLNEWELVPIKITIE